MEHTFASVSVEVWRQILASIPEEMGASLQRSAYSPNIKERLDFSCALFDQAGRLAAQAAHIPVHLGAMPLMLHALRGSVNWQAGDMWLTNDPRCGGTHLPDLTLVGPVFAEPKFSEDTARADPVLLGFVASRAHHTDIGGMAPGSLPLSTQIFQEGLILPPMRLMLAGRASEEVFALVCGNSRTPAERRGDLAAQIAANVTGARRLRDLMARYGRRQVETRIEQSIAYASAAVRAALQSLPPGEYTARDVMDGDGVGTHDIPLFLRLTITRAGTAHFDFTGTAPQVRGCLNATEAITRSACYYAVRCLVEDEIPTNCGCFEPISIVAPEGSLVNARFPAAVAAGNVETSQRLVDLCMQALASAAPDRIPACSQGTMNNVTIGGFDPIRDRPFAYYETICGGAGGGPGGPGLSAVHSHMTNTRNTPVETLESHYPLRVHHYSIADSGGGAGSSPGGRGVVRSIELLSDAAASLIGDRRNHPPPGAGGGSDGTPGGGGWGHETGGSARGIGHPLRKTVFRQE